MLEEDLALFRPEKDTLLTIGIFDGVHLGHKRLLETTASLAKKQDFLSGVVTFKDHPERVLRSRKELPYLTSLEERLRLIKENGIDKIVALPFNEELAGLGAGEFVGLLKKHLRMKGLVIGPDFALGKNRDGTIPKLRELGQDTGFSVTVVPPLVVGGEVVSSTAVRDALALGDMERATRLLGRPFSLRGQVVPGAGRGRNLGFPTANLDVAPEQALPAEGIYASFAEVQGKKLPSITYIGRRPTFDSVKRAVEVHIFEFSENIYSKELKIDIILKIRDDRRFDTPDDLKRQIKEDVSKARAVLKSLE